MSFSLILGLRMLSLPIANFNGFGDDTHKKNKESKMFKENKGHSFVHLAYKKTKK